MSSTNVDCRWEESGKYDPGMLEWGGENLEQSMRVWMCGGEIYVVRDSFVGHIFDRPAKPNPEVSSMKSSLVGNNRTIGTQFLRFTEQTGYSSPEESKTRGPCLA